MNRINRYENNGLPRIIILRRTNIEPSSNNSNSKSSAVADKHKSKHNNKWKNYLPKRIMPEPKCISDKITTTINGTGPNLMTLDTSCTNMMYQPLPYAVALVCEFQTGSKQWKT